MNEDPRCCGTGTCIINEDGLCWCGQLWDGEKMCFPKTDEILYFDVQVSEKSNSAVSQKNS
ncbi:hypothetical protein [Limnohabitans sp.]|uniref:hypothetical protein n=1 Tax=Limnohabitans sp. TaxID=1907725 RepID=UPI00286F6241|nr:hypothetical protein [Limnohabitans sp.]